MLKARIKEFIKKKNTANWFSDDYHKALDDIMEIINEDEHMQVLNDKPANVDSENWNTIFKRGLKPLGRKS